MSKQGRVVSLAVQREAKTAVDLAQCDGELAVVLQVEVIVLKRDWRQQIEILIVVGDDVIVVVNVHFRFWCRHQESICLHQNVGLNDVFCVGVRHR